MTPGVCGPGQEFDYPATLCHWGEDHLLWSLPYPHEKVQYSWSIAILSLGRTVWHDIGLVPTPQLLRYPWQGPSTTLSHVWVPPVRTHIAVRSCSHSWEGRDEEHNVPARDRKCLFCWEHQNRPTRCHIYQPRPLDKGPVLTPCLVRSTWMVRAAAFELRLNVSWLLWVYITSQMMLQWPPRQGMTDPLLVILGIGGGAPLCFVLLLIFFLPKAGRSPIPGQRLVGTVFWKVTR